MNEISLKDLLDSTFTINEKGEMVGEFTLKRINTIGDILKDQLKEIERLNNIINEFDKLIENEINESKLEDDYERVDSLKYCLATLKELKRVDKE